MIARFNAGLQQTQGKCCPIHNRHDLQQGCLLDGHGNEGEDEDEHRQPANHLPLGI